MPLDVTALASFWLAFGLALISPGPNFALMLRIGLAEGRKPALRTVLGIALGEAVWGSAAVLGVAALALRYPWLGSAIRLAGGAFLLWLAFGALRAAWQGPTAASATVSGPRGGFATGLALMLLNPKAGFFWVALTGVMLGPAIPLVTGITAVLGAVLLSLAWHLFLALAFSGRTLTGLYARARRAIEAVLGVALTALGFKLLAAS